MNHERRKAWRRECAGRPARLGLTAQQLGIHAGFPNYRAMLVFVSALVWLTVREPESAAVRGCDRECGAGGVTPVMLSKAKHLAWG